MWVTLLAIASIVILTLAAFEFRAADTKASSSPPNTAAGAAKAPPAWNAWKQVVAAPAKAPDGDSKAVRRATRPERNDALLGLLWLLMGSSRQR